ncbi:MAG: hypothetical protein U5R06_04605 [candidate division KSB1 bacterium]|nr:hypothetical protein [candidate division KSB1 bacterium]
MGKMLLIIVAASLIWMGFSSTAVRESLVEATTQTSHAYRQAKANNLAKSGVDYAMNQLALDSTWSGVQSKPFDNGTIDAYAASTSNLYPDRSGGSNDAKQITSIGAYEGVTDTIKVVVQFPPKLLPPPSFKYALASNAKLTVGGAALIHTENDDPINANIHTNSDLEVSGASTVRGYGSYSNSTNLSDSDASNYFKPYDTTTGQKLVQKVDGVEFPQYNLAKLEAEATVKYSGNQHFSGNLTMGSEENPAIYYIDGDLTISGNISGYGAFIVTGDIDITGSVTIDAITNNDLPNRLGLYAGDDMKIAGGSQVYAQLYVEDELKSTGTSDIYGLAVAKNGIKAGGDMTIHYKPMSDNVIPQTWHVERAGTPYIVSYYE